MDSAPRSPAAPGRPRSDQARAAILTTAMRLACRDGYQAVTILAVAAEAGVGRQTIYRWWPTKAAVLLEAITEYVLPEISPQLTGDARRDLRAVLRASFRLNSQLGPVVTGLMAEATSDPSFRAELQTRLLVPRRNLVRTILANGRAAGQLGGEGAGADRGVDLDLVVDMVWGTMWYRSLSGHAPVDEVVADELVDAVMRMLGAAPETR